jgi:hypothetical protein
MTSTAQANPVLGIVVLLALGVVYFLPFLIAKARGHRNSDSILLTNIFFGLSGVGWVIALIWAVSANTKSVATTVVTEAVATGQPALRF